MRTGLAILKDLAEKIERQEPLGFSTDPDLDFLLRLFQTYMTKEYFSLTYPDISLLLAADILIQDLRYLTTDEKQEIGRCTVRIAQANKSDLTDEDAEKLKNILRLLDFCDQKMELLEKGELSVWFEFAKAIEKSQCLFADVDGYAKTVEKMLKFKSKDSPAVELERVARFKNADVVRVLLLQGVTTQPEKNDKDLHRLINLAPLSAKAEHYFIARVLAKSSPSDFLKILQNPDNLWLLLEDYDRAGLPQFRNTRTLDAGLLAVANNPLAINTLINYAVDSRAYDALIQILIFIDNRGLCVPENPELSERIIRMVQGNYLSEKHKEYDAAEKYMIKTKAVSEYASDETKLKYIVERAMKATAGPLLNRWINDLELVLRVGVQFPDNFVHNLLVSCSIPKPGFDLIGVKRILEVLIRFGVDVPAQITTHEKSANRVQYYKDAYDRRGELYPILQIPAELKAEMQTLYDRVHGKKTLESQKVDSLVIQESQDSEASQSDLDSQNCVAPLAVQGSADLQESQEPEESQESQQPSNRQASPALFKLPRFSGHAGSSDSVPNSEQEDSSCQKDGAYHLVIKLHK